MGGSTTGFAAPAQQPATPDELIVVFERGASASARSAALAQAGARSRRSFPQIQAALVDVDDQRGAVRALARNPNVRYVQPNYVYTASALPDDPSFGQLWGLHNTGQTGGTPDADIDAPEAWDTTTGGADVTVAVIDTGVDFGHPDLAAQQWVNAGENCGSSDPTIACAQRSNGVDDDGNGLVDDWRGWDWVSNDNDPFDDQSHGTHVAGTIGAVGNNGTGVTGVSWNVRIMALKFLNSLGSGTTAGAVAATLYAADQGASVANNSWGGGAFDQALLDAIEYGAARGLLFVAAAGNDGRDNDASPTYPGSYDSDGVLAVAATDHNDTLASFSSYGRTTVDLGAPGVAILSTTPAATYGTKSGTSMATPHVSGVAALVHAAFPEATPYSTKALLLRTVDPVPSLAGRTLTGGRLNAATAAGCSDRPVAWLVAPGETFGVGVGDALQVRVLGASCGVPAGVANVAVTVNGSPVALSAASPDTGVYTGAHTVTAEGALTVSATVTVGSQTDTDVAMGTAVLSFSCQDVAWDGWIDATPYTNLGINLGSFKAIAMPFPFTFYGQTYTAVSVSSYGFLSFGSGAGTSAQVNTGIPNASLPNGLVAPFWDDLNPGFFGAGAVYGVWSGSAPNRYVTFEWFNVPHTFLVGAATFEVTLYESGEIRFRYLDTDFGDPRYDAGASATAGVESPSGTVGKQFSFNQPVLTNGKAISCLPAAAPPPEAPTIGTASLDDGTVLEAYSETLTAAGGTPPYAWSVDSGELPAGLSLDGATGTISGAPSAAGTSQFTVRVTDAASQSATQPLAIEVAEPLVITTAALSDGVAGSAYAAGVSAAGGAPPYAWSVVSGNLPPGLAIDPATGSISGAPTSAGTWAFDVQAEDSGTPVRSDAQALSITVLSQLGVTTASLPGGTVGQLYSQSITASGGGTPYSWSVVSGSLPSGLSLSSGTPSATVSGTPTAAGSYGFVVQVTDGVQTAQQALSIAVDSPSITVESVAYSTEGGRLGNRDLVVRVRIVLGSTPVAGASVRINLVRNGSVYATKTATTGTDGRAAFKFKQYPSGCYSTQVTRVTVDGQVFTPPTPANSHCK